MRNFSVSRDSNYTKIGINRTSQMGELTTSFRSDVSFESVDALVDRLKAQDEAAFAEVFELYKDMVYTLCCKLLAERADAMDVTQEVFLTLYRRISAFRGDCSLKTWLYRVTLNQAANRNRWWRRRFRNRTVSLNLIAEREGDTLVDPVCAKPLADRAALSEELQRAIHEGLGKLPFEQRAAVVLRDVQGLSYEEVAGVTGVQIGTVKSRIARGRERLRGLLQDFRPGRG